MLKEEFDWAFAETQPGTALNTLASRHSESLCFDPPREQEIRKGLPRGPIAADRVLAELRSHRDDEFYLMMAEYSDESDVTPSRDMTELAA